MAVCMMTSLFYKILVSMAIILNSLMYYASIVGALAGVGFCVSLALNFEKEIERITLEAAREESTPKITDPQNEVDYTKETEEDY